MPIDENAEVVFCLVDVAAFMDVEEFKARADRMIDGIKACRKRPGTEEIFVPGEPELRNAEYNTKHGIPIGPATIGEFETLCEEYEIPFNLQPLGNTAP